MQGTTIKIVPSRQCRVEYTPARVAICAHSPCATVHAYLGPLGSSQLAHALGFLGGLGGGHLAERDVACLDAAADGADGRLGDAQKDATDAEARLDQREKITDELGCALLLNQAA